MLKQRRYLVFEFLPVNGGTSTTRARWVPGLDHEVGDYAVDEVRIVVVAGDEGGEVLDCFWSVVAVELDNDRALDK